LLKGEALDERLRRESRLPVDECLRIGRETAEALAEAHDRNLIHRDIKPANIWLESPRGWVKLLDFGLAHAADDVHLTQTGAVLGTPAYMSPEQARGETVDLRSDLYSLGAVLYRLTTGELPVRGASTMALLMALATGTPRPPRDLNPELPPALNDLITRLLAKKPEERYVSAQAVADVICEIETKRTTPQPQVAGAKSGAGGIRRRWPWVAALAAAFFLAAIVVIVRDKEGNEIARITAPDGSTVSMNGGKVVPGVPADKAGGDPGNAPATRKVADIPPPVEIVEPPPLEAWLKGRTILTVA